MYLAKIFLMCVLSGVAVGNLPFINSLKSKLGKSRLFLNKYPMSEEKNPDPINLNTKEAQTVETLIPFTIHGRIFEPVEVHNNGKSVEVILDQPITDSYVTGGVLGTDVYFFKKKIYLWTNDTKGNAGTTIDGQSYPFDDTAIFYNKKCITYEIALALNLPDCFVKVIFLINTSPLPNVVFETYSPVLREVMKAGSKAYTFLGNAIAWSSAIIPPNAIYYVYPGSFKDDATGQEIDNVPVILIPHIPIEMSMSENQYAETLGSFKDASGQPLTYVESQHPTNGRPILKAERVANIVIP
ncbi:carbonic anhydrase 7-like [Planococcus citri]|uniref:carbonic anhydrase 7-like n=1 Tax=Planococcus citri TaxID=170843 RepID=UPI0031F9AE76